MNKHFLKVLFEQLDFPFLYGSADGIIKGANLFALKILKLEPDSYIGSNLYEHCCKKHFSLARFFESSKKLQSPLLKETYKLGSGQLCTISWKKYSFATKPHEESFFIVGYDISNEQAEIEKYKESVFFYESILSKLPTNVYWKDKKSVYMGCNERLANSMGLSSRDAIKGMTDYDFGWGKEAAKSFIAFDKKVMKSGQSLTTEDVFKEANGKIVTVLTNKTPLKNKEGKTVGILAISVDITDRKRIEEELHLAKIAAESANMLKTNFIQNMQHDIRTPASSIWALLDSFVENNEIPERDLLVMLRNSARQLWQICNDVIDFDRIEHGKTAILSKRFDIRQIIENVIELNQVAAFEKKLALSFSVDENIPHVVKGDDHRLSRILINLMGNALKFTPQGSISLSAKLIKERKKDYIIQFRLDDTGIGIPLEKQSTLYEKFNRLNPANRTSYKGSGLGLRIVKKYVDDLGGEINVKSMLNEGTTFFIDIPFEKALVNTIHESNKSNKTTAAPSERKVTPFLLDSDAEGDNVFLANKIKPRVLLIEDNELASKVAQMQLKSIHCQISTAIDVASALEKLKTEEFELVISDIGLPDGSGIDIIKLIKSDKNALNFSTPFIALTANVDPETVRHCKKNGFMEVMAKPAQVKAIKSFIAKHMVSKELEPLKQKDSLQQRLSLNLPSNEEELFQLEQYPLIDMRRGIEILGSKDLFYETLHEMMNTFPKHKAALKQANDEKDWQKVEQLAHKIKGGTAYSGLTRLEYACLFFDRYYKAGNFVLLEKLLQQIINIMNDTNEYFRGLIIKKD